MITKHIEQMLVKDWGVHRVIDVAKPWGLLEKMEMEKGMREGLYDSTLYREGADYQIG